MGTELGMRKSVIRDSGTPSGPPQQPNPGDTVLGCAHKPDLCNCHYYYLGSPGISYQRPKDGPWRTADWLLLCDKCFIKFGDDVHDALDRHKLPIACDMIWESGMEVTFTNN